MSDMNYSQFEFEEVSKKERYMSIIESLLFVTGDPLGFKEISKILETSEEYTAELIIELEQKYGEHIRGIKLINLNNTYQLVTKAENSDYIQKLLKKNARQSLSQASLESLAIIAYKQPITRVEIDEIRGVKSDSALQKLLEKNIIKGVGRLDVPGRPIQYGTTEEFLRQFGLGNLNELPEMDTFEESNQTEINEEF